MSVQAVTSGAEKKAGGTILGGNSSIVNNNSPGRAIWGAGPSQPNLPVTGSNVAKAVSAGAFAYDAAAADTYVINGYSTSIGGVANTVLQQAETVYGRRTHKKESQTTRLVAGSIRLGRYNEYDGTFSIAPSGSTENFGPDHANASPPTGELTYNNGSRTGPVNADLVARTTT